MSMSPNLPCSIKPFKIPNSAPSASNFKNIKSSSRKLDIIQVTTSAMRTLIVTPAFAYTPKECAPPRIICPASTRPSWSQPSD
eukprot:CAMPEP_0183423076 /NCGR_PEP_ID=MMETSP0370-20130417/28225_1 /TAXON_ID=268820 /ORGANISM="Peridinium aciculiferum, Strain PAER-2" /LENGTH=82 /DNA_ID=CAMNT_0025607213 /DNA_START=407 /DNA_END=652 /DNA_ORIENTATION=-